MLNEKYPCVSIIFPNWNGKDDAIECLNSLRKQNYPKDVVEIIIIDNGSKDGSVEAINTLFIDMKEEDWLNLRLIKNNGNLGSCIARNKGIMVSYEDSKYIWMLDNDVVVDPKALIELVKIIEKNNKYGVVSSVNYYYDYPEEIFYVGNMLNWNTWIFKKIKNSQLIKSGAYSIDCAATSSLLIKKKVIEEIGLLDTDYFCYFNDVDWCIRVKMKKYKIVSVMSSKVWHKVSKNIEDLKDFKTYYSMRNLIIVIKKNAPHHKYRIFLLYLFMYYLPRKIFLYISKKKKNILKSFLRGFRDGLLFK